MNDAHADGHVISHEGDHITVLCDNGKEVKIDVGADFSPKLPPSLLDKNVMVLGYMSFFNGEWDFIATKLTIYKNVRGKLTQVIYTAE